jgi:hypothetical protein
VLSLAAAALLRIWLVGEASGQERNTATGAVLIVAVALLTLWLAFLSRLPRRLRLLASVRWRSAPASSPRCSGCAA